MKKFTKTKGGFTLTEIILVVAIVVILSSAAFAGVAVTLNRADKMKKDLSANNGNNFEASAWVTVKNINFGDGGYIPQATYEPEDPTEPSASNPSESNGSESLTPEEVVEYDTQANKDIQTMINVGISKKDIWVTRDAQGNITGWVWYCSSDPVYPEDMDDATKAALESHRTSSRPQNTVTNTNNNNNNNNWNNNNQNNNNNNTWNNDNNNNNNNNNDNNNNNNNQNDNNNQSYENYDNNQQSNVSNGTNAAGSSISSTSNDWWNSKLTFNNGVEKVIVVVPDGSSMAMDQWQYTCKQIPGTNKYEITYQGDGNGRTKQKEITVRLPDGGYIESYS